MKQTQLVSVIWFVFSYGLLCVTVPTCVVYAAVCMITLVLLIFMEGKCVLTNVHVYILRVSHCHQLRQVYI